jgi:hypothetical protein
MVLELISAYMYNYKVRKEIMSTYLFCWRHGINRNILENVGGFLLFCSVGANHFGYGL